jgi:pantetheine-phosphate adenylyltransferase
MYAGSFDPVHLGHMSVITFASEQFEALYVVVTSNTLKQTGFFDSAKRTDLLAGATAHLRNVDVVAQSGLLIDAAAHLGADVLVRSAGKEITVEKGMAYMNGHGGIPTVLLPTDPVTSFISSTQVRAVIASGGRDQLRNLVPENVIEALYRSNSNTE